MFSPHIITALFVALALASVGYAPPTPSDREVSNLSARGVAPTSRFVIYSDYWVTGALPAASTLKGYNVVALSFLTLTGAVDQAGNWAALSTADKAAKTAEYHNAGIKIIVSAFGATDTPTTSGANAFNIANTMAQWVKSNGLDGIDVDYEDLTAMNRGDGAAEQWVSEFTTTLRETLPKGQYILSHAPLAPWLAPNSQFAAGAYVTINNNVGSLIDWFEYNGTADSDDIRPQYNVQFYNQGLYTDCTGLLTSSGGAFPGSSLFEIPKNGIPLNKLVIGKPATEVDATDGFMDPATLGSCVEQANAKGWNAGVMVWQFPHADAAWIQSAKGGAF
uniref:Lmo1883 protein n=1 Tax=Ganoderma boninense TaxID=34458 RepID=A0A5K1JZF1_9APHY|nr:Lmo1883 protein [Ganoderma boninense]